MRIKEICRLAAVCCMVMLVKVRADAQEGGNGADMPKTVTLSRQQLKAFEGVFQSAQNKELNVQFVADSNWLTAKLLWNGGQLRIYPQSDLVFFSKEGERVNLTFIKAADGAINQMNLGNNGLWNRVKDYKPLVKTELQHTPAQIKVYEGLYQNDRNKNMYLEFAEKDNYLVLKQQWDG